MLWKLHKPRMVQPSDTRKIIAHILCYDFGRSHAPARALCPPPPLFREASCILMRADRGAGRKMVSGVQHTLSQNVICKSYMPGNSYSFDPKILFLSGLFEIRHTPLCMHIFFSVHIGPHTPPDSTKPEAVLGSGGIACLIAIIRRKSCTVPLSTTFRRIKIFEKRISVHTVF